MYIVVLSSLSQQNYTCMEFDFSSWFNPFPALLPSVPPPLHCSLSSSLIDILSLVYLFSFYWFFLLIHNSEIPCALFMHEHTIIFGEFILHCIFFLVLPVGLSIFFYTMMFPISSHKYILSSSSPLFYSIFHLWENTFGLWDSQFDFFHLTWYSPFPPIH